MFKSLLVSAIALMFSAQAAAMVVTIDSFSTSQANVSDLVGGGATTSAPIAPTMGEIWTTRTLSVEAIGAGFNPGDPSAIVTMGIISIANDPAENSKVDLVWNVGAVASLIGATNGILSVDFQFHNAGIPPTMITFTVDGVALASVPLSGANGNVSASLSAAQLNAFASGTIVKLSVTGGDGFDVVLDNVQLSADPAQVPVPGSLALLAGGLFGLRFTRKGRSAK